MKKIYRILIYFFMIFSLAGLISGCQDSDSEADSTNSFKVISSGGPVNGYYILNNESPIEFQTALLEGSSFYYTYEKNLEAPESIYISATAPDVSTSSITIFIYEDSELVQSPTVTQSEATVKVTSTLSYTFDATTDTNDTSDSSEE